MKKHMLALAVLLTVSAFAADTSEPKGWLNPAVTQANIYQTICVSGYTATIRPPVSYTNSLKKSQMHTRALPGVMSDYEEDHFVPLGLGGHPTNPQNLFPELWADAHKKDVVEVGLMRRVCAGTMTLARAQQVFLTHQWQSVTNVRTFK